MSLVSYVWIVYESIEKSHIDTQDFFFIEGKSVCRSHVVLQCVARVLQCVAACCSVLRCVAVWCSVLQYVAFLYRSQVSLHKSHWQKSNKASDRTVAFQSQTHFNIQCVSNFDFECISNATVLPHIHTNLFHYKERDQLSVKKDLYREREICSGLSWQKASLSIWVVICVYIYIYI